jgi:hypothetical protein
MIKKAISLYRKSFEVSMNKALPQRICGSAA